MVFLWDLVVTSNEVVHSKYTTWMYAKFAEVGHLDPGGSRSLVMHCLCGDSQ